MKQDFIDRSYLNAQEDLRISSVKDGPVCVLNDSISELGFDKTLESQNDKFQTNKQKHAGDNLITNCLEQDYDVTKTVFMANSEILETQEEAAKVTECLQRYPVVLLTRLDTENFGQLFFDKICMNCVEINNNNSAKTTENFQTSSPDKIRFSENVTNDSHTFLPQKIKMEMISENALNTTDTNDIDPVCSPASSMDENDDQALPLVISEVRWNAKDIFYDNTPIKDNQSDNANYFNSNIVDSNIVEPFFSLLEAIESNNHTSSKVSQSSPSTKTASVPTSTMPLEGSLPSENVPMPETGCSVDKVSDSDFQFKDQIYESSVAKDNNSENSDQRLSPKLSGKKDLRNRRKCQRVVNYSDDSSLDCLLDSMDKAHKKNRRNKSKHMPPLMKEIRKKATAYSKCRKRAELGNSSGKNLDTGNKVSQKRTNSVLESLTTYENNLHENAVKPIKILFSDTNAEVNPDKTSKRKSEDKGDLKDTELSSSIMKSEKKASRMRAVFQKLEKEISFSLTATPSHKKTLPSDEESIDCIKVVSSLKETKPQSTSPVPSHMKQRDKRFSVDSHYLQKRPSPGLRREEKHRKRGNKVPSHCSSPGSDNSHDQQAGPSKKTKKKRGHINDDEAPLKRLARELPRFNWLEDKIKNSSQTSSVQLVKETRTEKSVITMDNGPILKNKVINNSQFDESIIGAAQNQTLYEKTCDITESTDCIFPGQNNFEKTVEIG
ncbi:uncharacterized protein LOC106458317 [Limulus polyphemus]|uniref:Uncharacterized protein LOC106458317 n=1 Tax=Limulus polyphemus TaxID=6850 RepID=A0ABM1B263_LIMPO|nr:uncharacterized protein LOC106458317 [Limulus polyphemus]XP_022240204.1 uncharacterized protein LOC106458317 [Limulus polyphemus]XP_022240205.1 uncharacterized protein LOC106458317 [Limulus polyphemus]